MASGHSRPSSNHATRYLFGCGVYRRYGLTALNPFGNSVFASASVTAGVMMHSCPSFQFTGVATLYLAVS